MADVRALARTRPALGPGTHQTHRVTTPEPRPAGVPGTDPTVDFPGAGPSASAGTTAPSAGGPPSGPAQTAPPTPARHTGRTIGRTVALALLVFLTVVLVLFVVFNTQAVDISLVFTDVNAPLVLALLIAAVLGGAVAALLNAVMTVRGRRKNR
jgi:uncharacterized integral membrane protein